MNVPALIQDLDLRPADAIVVKKSLGLLDHYVIYLGEDNLGDHWFIANMESGVRVIDQQEAAHQLQNRFRPNRVNYFMGSEEERWEAVNRAYNYPSPDSYHLILNNCEHFYSYVASGVKKSQQVETLGKGLIAGGTAVMIGGAAARNKNAAIIGGVAAGLGLLTLLFEGLTNDE